MKNLLVGINFSTQSPTIIKFALRLAQYFSAQLTVATILDKNRYVDELDLQAGQEGRVRNLENIRLREKAKLEQFVQQYYSKQYHSTLLNIHVEYGDPHLQLYQLAEQGNADLLIVGKLTKTGRMLFADTSDHFISYAPCPIFIVPEEVEFHAFDRIVYASNFILEDCAAILYLREWVELFNAELVCLHIYQNEKDKKRANRKLNILNQLFPQENITFRMAIAPAKEGIERYVSLSEADLVATTHRARNLLGELFQKSISKRIAHNLTVPMLVFQQN